MQPRDLIEAIAWRAGIRAAPYILHELNLSQSSAKFAILGAFHALGATQIKLSGAESHIPERAHAYFRSRLQELVDEPRAAVVFAIDLVRMCFLAGSDGEAANRATEACSELYQIHPDLWDQATTDLKYYLAEKDVARLLSRPLLNDAFSNNRPTEASHGIGPYGLGPYSASFSYQHGHEWQATVEFLLAAHNDNWNVWVDWLIRQSANFQANRAFAFAFTRMTEDDWKADVSEANSRLSELMNAPPADGDDRLGRVSQAILEPEKLVLASDRVVRVTDNQELFDGLSLHLDAIRDQYASDHNKGEFQKYIQPELLIAITDILVQIEVGEIILSDLGGRLKNLLLKTSRGIFVVSLATATLLSNLEGAIQLIERIFLNIPS